MKIHTHMHVSGLTRNFNFIVLTCITKYLDINMLTDSLTDFSRLVDNLLNNTCVCIFGLRVCGFL